MQPQRLVGAHRRPAVSPAIAERLAEYLASVNLSNQSKHDFELKTSPRPAGRATQVIITEYDLLRKEIQPLAHLALQGSVIRRRHDLFAAAGGRQRPLGHQPAPRGRAGSGQRHVGEPPSLPSCPARSPGSTNLLRRCPAPTALNRCDDLNSIRRIGHRHGCMPHTCQVGDRVRSVRGRSHSDCTSIYSRHA